MQEVFLFPCTGGSLKQEGHTQRQTLRLQRVENFDAGGVPSTLGEARSDPLQSARCDSLREENGDANISEADRDDMEARTEFMCMCGDIYIYIYIYIYIFKYKHISFHLSPPYHAQRTINCMYRMSHQAHFRQKYIKVVRQTRTNLDNLEVSAIDDLRIIGGHSILCES